MLLVLQLTLLVFLLCDPCSKSQSVVLKQSLRACPDLEDHFLNKCLVVVSLLTFGLWWSD